MVSSQQGLKRLAGAVGFLFGVAFLGTLVRTGMASAQCGPLGSKTANNTACGTGTLEHNTTGTNDSAFGTIALQFNTTGFRNSAFGKAALFSNTYGSENTASGEGVLYNNNGGSTNTADGYLALFRNTTGSANIGLGVNAGNNIIAGSNNIEIGSAGTSDESNTIRIGTKQQKTFIAGTFGQMVNSNGLPVLVDNTGKLGVIVSSARYKRDIHDMGGASAGLMKLRPVTFRYKSDPSGTLQYGLVAEEVERVYPELVVHGTDGKVMSVRYLEFTALLLNELQKQNSELQKQAKETQQRLETKDRQLAAQQREIDALKQQNASINALSQRLAALEQQVHTVTSQGLRSLASK